MWTKILSAALIGLEAEIIEVEADSGGGDFGQIAIVGLPDTSTSEAKERVKSALRNCNIEYPKRKITVNLAPANVRKHGPAYDLPIAMSILCLKNKFQTDFKNCLVVGELSLSGDVRPVSGILAIALKAKKLGIVNLYIPEANLAEASLISDLNIFPVKNLIQLINHCQNKIIIKNAPPEINLKSVDPLRISHQSLALIKGQENAKRALEIAAAGGHNLLLIGPPGSGKTMLAKALPGLLPNLSNEEVLEVSNIYSVAGEFTNNRLITERPFRSPHHSASGIALIGGGNNPRPGEITLAHRGALFLDELPEFSRRTLENLRQPLEDRVVHISRASSSLIFPSNFILIAAMNPCPCGYLGDPIIKCKCRDSQIHNYKRRISGPIIDRIDLHVQVPRINLEKINNFEDEGETETAKNRIQSARNIQIERYRGLNIKTNAEMSGQTIKLFCKLDTASHALLIRASLKLNLSPRAYFRVLKIARTIADLDLSAIILLPHIAEALSYRPKLE